jgi:hypothetical protein
MNVPLLVGVASLALWVILVFVVQVAAGWIHIPLVLGVLALVKAIVEGSPSKSPSSKT